MQVNQIMKERVVTISMDDRLKDVKEIFDQVSFHHLLVVDDKNRLAGILTEGDMLSALSPFLGFNVEMNRDQQTLAKRVHQVMTRPVISVGANATVLEVCELLTSRRIGCVPVVDHDKKVIGVITWRDLVTLLAGKLK